MPLYEYTCRPCAREFEALLFPGEQEADVVCPVCQGREVERQLSATAAPKSVPSGSLPVGSSCNTSLPPCGPGCCRVPS
jgi:putative FmdB family regulatory protein